MILVVDDHPDTAKLLCRLLDRCGYQSVHCESAQNALETLRVVRPEIVILDVMMPAMDGLTLLDHIRRTQGLDDLPVVMYSASPDDRHRHRARALGAVGYLLKGSASVVELLGVVSRYTQPEPT